MKLVPRLRDLPLFWKLLLPFFALLVLLGGVGTILVGRDLSSRARAVLNEDLLRRSLAARSAVLDRELYLLEAATFAGNVQGMAAAVGNGDRSATVRLLRSVLALKKDLDLLVVTDRDGAGLAELTPARVDRPRKGGRWLTQPAVARALADSSGAKSSGLMSYEGRTYIVVVSPICIAVRACSPIGAALVGVDAARLATDAAAAWSSSPGDDEGGATIFDGDGRTLGATGLPIPRLDVAEALQAVRRTTHAGSEEIATLYAPLEVQGSRIGTLAVAVKTAPALAAAKGARYWLIPVLLAGLAGLVGIGSLLTRSILKQVRSLVATNRALGSGLLTARVPVSSRDELGELALGLNQMAEQLQANVQTLEMRVEQRTEEIHRLMLERSEFFAALSHELRTPLAVILAEAKMLHDPAYRKKGGWSSHAGHTIEESAGQLLALVNDILELAKAEAGHIDVKREPVRLTDVVKGARRTIEGLGKGAGIRVRVNIPADLPPVWGDQVRLREVVIGLVENAVKYTPSGGRITVSAAARNGHVEIAVSDTGVGIPPDARERIFEPFFRVQGTTALRGQPSTGLGLALAKRLVEAQEGTIDFVSELGTGTTFRFTLRPVDPAAGPEPASP